MYVGKELTASGDTLIAGSGEEVSSHWLEIVPRQEHGPDETIEVGVTEDASIPGELLEIPQVAETNRYITMNYSDYEGFPAPLTNGGLNDQGVAIRDIWSTSREELIEMTPTPQQGPQYSDLARIALERAGSAREAVEIIGNLIDEHGYSTYGGNSHMIADEDEAWVMIQAAGGEGIWAAERLGPGEVRVSYPGYIGEMPEDYQESEDFMGSDNLFSFAEEQGWYESGEPFNFHEVYGDQSVELRSGSKYVSQAQLEEELQEMAPDVTVKDMMDKIGDERFVEVVRTASDSYKAVIDHTVALQERNVRFAQGSVQNAVDDLREQAESNRAFAGQLIERAEKQREAYRMLAEPTWISCSRRSPTPSRVFRRLGRPPNLGSTVGTRTLRGPGESSGASLRAFRPLAAGGN